MQKQVNGVSNTTSGLSYQEAQMRNRSLWLRFSGFLCALLVVLVTVALIPHLAHAGTKGSATAKLTVDANARTISFSANIKDALPNTNMVAHVHFKDCTGPTLFMLDKQKTDGSGNTTWNTPFHNENGSTANNHVVTKAIPLTWFFNVHNADITDPSTGKAKSIGCLILTPSQDRLTATATTPLSD